MSSRIIRRALCAAAVASPVYMSSAASLHATPLTTEQITGSYSVSYSKSDHSQNAPSFSYTLNHNGFSESLSRGISTGPLDFFTINPSNSCGNGWACWLAGTQSGTITVDFTFKETLSGATGTLSEAGLYQAKYYGSVLPCAASDPNSQHGQSDCINWNAPSVIPVTFTNGDILDVTFYDAVDWSIKPKIGFDLLPSQNHVTVPEPSTLALFGGLLLALGCVRVLRRV